MKKFYHLVSIQRRDEGGVALLLDGKPVKTPEGHLLLSPTEALANLLLREWAAQGETIEPATMPVTQLLVTLLDHIEGRRAEFHERLMDYLDTDLVCYRAEGPPQLAAAQRLLWDPLLHWFEIRFGVSLSTTTGLIPLRQEERAHALVNDYILDLPIPVFMILQTVTSETGSLLAALAFVEKVIDSETAFALTQIEEDYKAGLYHEDRYGLAPEIERKRAALRTNLAAARDFLEALE